MRGVFVKTLALMLLASCGRSGVEYINTSSENQLVRKGVRWVRFLSFNGNSTYSINSGANIPLVGLGALRAKEGTVWNTLRLDGEVSAEVGYEQDPFPGAIQSNLLPKTTYFESAGASLTTINTIIFALQSGPKLATRIRRITVFNPGSMTTPGFINFQLMYAADVGTAVSNPANAVRVLKYRYNAPAYTGRLYAGQGDTITGFGAGDYSFNFPFYIGATTASFVPYVWDVEGEKNIESPTFRNGEWALITNNTAAYSGHKDLIVGMEFTEEPY